MGNREDLLAGARRCLYEKGYVRTSARDIAAAAGTSLAAIGYHFGSKEALLNAALVQATAEWGDELERVIGREIEPADDPLRRFELTWARIIDSFATHRDLWATQFKLLAEIDDLPHRSELLGQVPTARLALAELFGYHDHEADPDPLVVGTFLQALLTGVLTQWMTDPDQAVSGSDLARSMRAILRS